MKFARRSRPALVGVALGVALVSPGLGPGGRARAGGYDTPMLYSARHMGMGGTAIGAVDDPSALFHNPAGLGKVRGFAGLVDVSLLLARIKSTIDPMTARDLESERTVAPMFLVGGAYRLNDWLVAGLGVFPIASAGATYKYSFLSFTTEQTTRLVFLEATPALAANLLEGRLRLGLGYRVTYVSLERFIGDRNQAAPSTDFKLTGVNALGLRAGLQYTITDGIEAGAVYRHMTRTKVKSAKGRANSAEVTDLSTEFVLPSKLGGGVRADLCDVGLAVDLEYLFNSQNEGYPLKGTLTPTAARPVATAVEVPNVAEWKNEITLRTGVEYRLLEDPAGGRKRIALRAGYVYDGVTTNPQYPSAFGTPPGPTHLLTVGGGVRFGRWQTNLAYARRFGEGAVTTADLTAPGRRSCAFCGAAGSEPYRIGVHGLYVDVSVATE